MMRLIAFVLVCLLFVQPVSAEQVPGTSVSLTPPVDFVKAKRFAGFMQEETGSSILVLEMPAPYAEVTSGFNDQKNMKARGLKLLSKASTKVDGKAAVLYHFEQTAYGRLFRKWMVVVDRSGAITMITATYLKSERKSLGKPLKTAILAATFGPPSDPADALLFTVTPSPPFKTAKIMGQMTILCPNGIFPGKDESIPLIVLGVSFSTEIAAPKQKAFAERRVLNIDTIEEIFIENTTDVKIGNLSGYTTIAAGTGDIDATPMTIYQVLLFDKSGYCIIQGITPTANNETNLPIFKKIAKSFRMKK